MKMSLKNLCEFYSDNIKNQALSQSLPEGEKKQIVICL